MYKISVKELHDYQDRLNVWCDTPFPIRSFGDKKFGKEEKFSKEQNTFIKFIVPLLDILGWETRSERVEFEYTVISVGDKKRKIRVDAALYVPENQCPQVLVEVKKMTDTLGSGNYLLRYLNKNSKVKYGIYTNGKELKFVDDTTPKKNEPSGLFSIKSEDFHKWSDVLSLLSFESVRNGVLNDFVKSYHDKFWGWRNEEIKKRKHSDYELRLMFAKDIWRDFK